MFSRYSECDPLTSGSIMEPDQLLPHYVMDIARTIPGLSGLFTAGIFSAALRCDIKNFDQGKRFYLKKVLVHLQLL